MEIDQIWRLWKKYIDYYVIGNTELKRSFFWTFMGILLHHRNCSYIESAKKKTLRIHTFMIQDSGTGKTQVMENAHILMNYLGIKSRWTLKDNESAATGSCIFDHKDKSNSIKKGYLSELEAYSWDEGNVLLRPSGYMDVLTDHLQTAMDDPGHVSKGMRFGTIEYKTNVTLIAGSYMSPDIKKALLSKGFLQRMMISYKDHSPAEKRDIRIGIGLLKLKHKSETINSINYAIKQITGKLPENKNIIFDEESVKKFNEDSEELYRNFIEYSYAAEKQRILETFFNRMHIIIDKIASIKAIIEGKDKVYYEDMKYGLEECKWHIKSLHGIFEYLERGKTTTVKEQREMTILNIIRKHDGKIPHDELLSELHELKKAGIWDFGYPKSVELIQKMILKHAIHSEKAKKGIVICFIK